MLIAGPKEDPCAPQLLGPAVEDTRVVLEHICFRNLDLIAPLQCKEQHVPRHPFLIILNDEWKRDPIERRSRGIHMRQAIDTWQTWRRSMCHMNRIPDAATH